jgi:Fic family protein
MTNYNPPFDFNPEIIDLVEEIGEALGTWSAFGMSDSPQLRRSNRIRTIQASLEIENNTLSIEQVTAVLDGKRVLGLPREIKEVQNAFIAYEQINQWQADNYEHLLQAHAVLMEALLDHPGKLRTSGVGIYRGDTLVHMPPPASQISRLMNELLNWLKSKTTHPLIASCIFHYEFEFIHPFTDGNGRIGRLWQTLILSKWKPILAYLPVETVIRDKQTAYYEALLESDKAANSTIFVQFMLQSLLTAIKEVAPTNEQLLLFEYQNPLVSKPHKE